jgi:hypothetical protein
MQVPCPAPQMVAPDDIIKVEVIPFTVISNRSIGGMAYKISASLNVGDRVTVCYWIRPFLDMKKPVSR